MSRVGGRQTDTLTRLTADVLAVVERPPYVPRHALPDAPAVGVAQVPVDITPEASRLGILTFLRVGRRR